MENILKIAVIEDSTEIRESIVSILNTYCKDINIVGEASDVEEAIGLIATKNPDLVLMDIQLKTGTSFDVLEKIYQFNISNPEVIFITGYGTYENATKAIDFSAIDFITKPIVIDKLIASVEKARNRSDEFQKREQIAFLLENLNEAKNYIPKIGIQVVGGVIEFIELNKIVYLEADTTISKFHLEDNRTLKANKNIGHFIRLFANEINFTQVSQSLLVNMDYIKKYNHNDFLITLKNNKEIYTSRRYSIEFKKNLQNYSNESISKDNVLKNLLNYFKNI